MPVPYTLREQRLRERRWSSYLLFLGAMFLALIAVLPVLTASVPAKQASRTIAVPPGFEALDRNHDGRLDRAELARARREGRL